MQCRSEQQDEPLASIADSFGRHGPRKTARGREADALPSVQLGPVSQSGDAGPNDAVGTAQPGRRALRQPPGLIRLFASWHGCMLSNSLRPGLCSCSATARVADKSLESVQTTPFSTA